MKFVTALVALALIASEAFADAELEEKFFESMKRGLEVQMLLFQRIGPEFGSKLKQVTFSEDDRKVFSCVIERAEQQDLESLFEEAADRNEAFNEAVLADPSISMATMRQHPEVMQLMMSQAEIGTEEQKAAMKTINDECGATQLMMAKMNESGLMEVLQSVSRK